MYLARRNPDLARGSFPERWRRHGELAMSLPFWRHASGYFHNDVLEDPPSGVDSHTPEPWSSDYDGVGVVFLPSAADMESLITHQDFPVLLADEWGAFNEPVANFSVLTTEEVHKERRGTAIKFFAFLRAAAGVDRADFTARWRAHVGLVMRSEDLSRLVLRYAHNHPVPLEAAGESEMSVRDRIDQGIADVGGIVEVGFASRADMEAYLQHPDRAAIRADLERFVDLERSIFVATNEVTMDARARAAG